MLTGTLEHFEQDKRGPAWVFGGTSPEQLAEEVGSLLARNKYKLEKGTPVQAVYGRGSGVLRVLFGAFVPRYKLVVRVKDSAGKAMLEIEKGMSGASGGLIGASKMKKEFTRIIRLIEDSCQE